MEIRLDALRVALSIALATPDDRTLQIALAAADSPAYAPSNGGPTPHDDHDPEATRLRALVDLAKDGDSEAFGQLYDHYVTGVFRFIYYRVGSQQLAEDLTSETFVRGLRAIQRFNWQGKDFGAWLTTIARNLVADHFKSSRARLETPAQRWGVQTDVGSVLVCGSGSRRGGGVSGLGGHSAAMAVLSDQ